MSMAKILTAALLFGDGAMAFIHKNPVLQHRPSGGSSSSGGDVSSSDGRSGGSSGGVPSYTFPGMRHVHFSINKGSARKGTRGSALGVSPVELNFDTHSEDKNPKNKKQVKQQLEAAAVAAATASGDIPATNPVGGLLSDAMTAQCVAEWAEAVAVALDDKRRIDEVVGMFAYDGVVKVSPYANHCSLSGSQSVKVGLLRAE